MKKPFALTLVCFSLLLAACGKSDNSATVDPNAAAAQSTPVVATAPVGTTYPVQSQGMTLQQYCQMYNGQFNGSTCAITQTSYGQQWSVQLGSFNTGLAVYAGQRLTVTDSGNPTVLVGGVSVGTGNVNVVATYSGYLSFQGSSLFSSFNVSTVQITTCFNAPGTAVACQ